MGFRIIEKEKLKYMSEYETAAWMWGHFDSGTVHFCESTLRVQNLDVITNHMWDVIMDK